MVILGANLLSSDGSIISFGEGKGMCKNPEYVDYLKRTLEWRMQND